MTRCRAGVHGSAGQRSTLAIAAVVLAVLAGELLFDVTPSEALVVAPHALFIDHLVYIADDLDAFRFAAGQANFLFQIAQGSGASTWAIDQRLGV